MVRAAIVGLGWWGRVMVEACRARGGELTFTHAVVRDLPAATSWAAERGIALLTTLDAALADPDVDAVVLATPNSQHVDQIIRCARAGKPVYSEKPLALTLTDARRAVDACVDAGVVLGLGTDRRLLPGVQRLADLVGSGRLGAPLQIEAQYSNDNMSKGASGSWRSSTVEAPGGGMTGPGLHALDGLVHLGGPIALVAGQLLHPSTNDGPVDAGALIGAFCSGAGFTLGCVRGTPDYFRLSYFGTNGWAELRNYGEVLVRVAGDPPVAETYPSDLAIADLLDAFAASISSGSDFPVPTESMLATVAAFEASIHAMSCPGHVVKVRAVPVATPS